MPKDDFHNGWTDREDRGVQDPERNHVQVHHFSGFRVGDPVEHVDNAPGYIGTIRKLHADKADVLWPNLADPEPYEYRFLKPAGTETPDPVNSPAHYTAYPHEVIEFTECLNFNRGNAVKYIARAGLKNPDTEVEDLEKAAWYIARELKRIGGAK